MFISVFDDRCITGATPPGRTGLQVFDCLDGIYFADVVVTLYDSDFCLIFPYNLEDFFHCLFEFIITDTAADIEGNIYLCLIVAQLAPQVLSFRRTAVAAGLRFFIAAGYRSGKFL